MVIVFFHLVNGRGSAGSGQVTRALSHPETDTAPAPPPSHRCGDRPGVSVKPAPFAFVRPQGLQHALEALAADPGAKVLAGGQSLVPLLSMRLAAPSTLVDINALPDLDHVRADEQGVHVGALARHADVLASADVRRVQPLVTLALEHVAHATIRNRGTTVGSIVHADAAAEMPMVMALLGGSVDCRVDVGHPRRSRPPSCSPVPSSRPCTTTRSPSVRSSRPWPRGRASASRRSPAGTATTPWCGVGAVVGVDGDAVVSARVGYLSVSDVPTVVDVTAALEGTVSADATGAAAELALGELDPADDVHATAAYRSQLVRVLTDRVLRAAYADARERTGAAA